MLKQLFSPFDGRDLERKAGDALRKLLTDIPSLKVNLSETSGSPDEGFDIRVDVDFHGRRRAILCEVKKSGQPRHVHLGAFHIKNAAAELGKTAVPMIIVPYMTPDTRSFCRKHGVNYLDLEGNAYLAFDGVFIERAVPTKPPAVRRGLRSLYKPKSARILKVLLRNPGKAWRVTDLAQAAHISLGHVSNVRTALVDRMWAEVSTEGLRLSEPDALLDEWRDLYAPDGQRVGFYTPLHGKAAQEAARSALGVRPQTAAAFASFSAGQWLAPYGRTETQYFYAREGGIARLTDALHLTPAASGGNVEIIVPKDDGVFLDTAEPATGAICTSPLQTYLDLYASGERGREAAEHLRRERLQWRGQ